MTLTQFLQRAKDKGCQVNTSGMYIFVSDGNVTVRISPDESIAMRQVSHTKDFNFTRTNMQAASRALKLPRK